MAARTALSALRNGIQKIYREVRRERGDGEASNAAVLVRVRAQKAEGLSFFNSELVKTALTMLLNDVSRRRRGRGYSPEGIDLFGGYRVPRGVTIFRGKKKGTAKLSFREAELYVKAHSEKSTSDHHEPLRCLLDECREYVESDEDALEALVACKRQAHKRAVAKVAMRTTILV